MEVLNNADIKRQLVGVASKLNITGPSGLRGADMFQCAVDDADAEAEGVGFFVGNMFPV